MNWNRAAVVISSIPIAIGILVSLYILKSILFNGISLGTLSYYPSYIFSLTTTSILMISIYTLIYESRELSRKKRIFTYIAIAILLFSFMGILGLDIHLGTIVSNYFNIDPIPITIIVFSYAIGSIIYWGGIENG